MSCEHCGSERIVGFLQKKKGKIVMNVAVCDKCVDMKWKL